MLIDWLHFPFSLYFTRQLVGDRHVYPLSKVLLPTDRCQIPSKYNDVKMNTFGVLRPKWQVLHSQLLQCLSDL